MVKLVKKLWKNVYLGPGSSIKMMYFQDFRGKTSDWAVGRLLQPLGLRQPGPSTNFSQIDVF